MPRDGLLLVAEPGEEPRVELSRGPFRLGEVPERVRSEEVSIDWDPGPRALRVRATLFGSTPVYWSRDPAGTLRAASKVRRLFESGVPRELDVGAALAALAGLPKPDGRTLFRGVRSLPPGATLGYRDRSVTIEAAGPRTVPASPVEPAELRRLLRHAIENRMAEEGITFCSLSGGVDSSWLLALAARTGRPVVPVRMEDEGRSPEESRAATRLCAELELSPRTVRLAGADLSAVMPEAVEACETLLWNALAVERYLALRRLHEEGGVLLSGAGADELLLGQPALLARDRRGRPAWRRRLLEDAALVRSLLRPGRSSAVRRPPRLSGTDPRPYLISQLLPESTLPIEARAAAACGLRARFPYLDASFAAAALSWPEAQLLGRGLGKIALREGASLDLPSDHAWLAKRGGASPAGGGLRSRRQWLLLYRRWLDPEALVGLPFLQPERVSELLDAFAVIAPGDERREAVDRILMRLSSLSVLQHGLIAGMTRALAVPGQGGTR